MSQTELPFAGFEVLGRRCHGHCWGGSDNCVAPSILDTRFLLYKCFIWNYGTALTGFQIRGTLTWTLLGRFGQLCGSTYFGHPHLRRCYFLVTRVRRWYFQVGPADFYISKFVIENSVKAAVGQEPCTSFLITIKKGKHMACTLINPRLSKVEHPSIL